MTIYVNSFPGAICHRIWTHDSDSVPAGLRFLQRNRRVVVPQFGSLYVHVLGVLHSDVQEEPAGEEGPAGCTAKNQAIGAEQKGEGVERPLQLHGRL